MRAIERLRWAVTECAAEWRSGNPDPMWDGAGDCGLALQAILDALVAKGQLTVDDVEAIIVAALGAPPPQADEGAGT